MRCGKDCRERRDACHDGTARLIHIGSCFGAQRSEPRQHIAFKFRHFVATDAFFSRKSLQIGKHEADGVAQPAIRIGRRLDDLRSDAQVFGEIGRRDPQAQDFGAVLFHDALRRHHIAERFRHLASLLVEHEAMRQHRVIGCVAARAAALQQG